ncbi:MAG: hypothetical protein J2P49_10920 [Methylocapsa sp.]|nr:hypothetical protein [Methylocapsa sp.]
MAWFVLYVSSAGKGAERADTRFARRPAAQFLAGVSGLFRRLGAPCALMASAAQPQNILVLGNSLSYGFGLPESQGFPSQLKRKLLADGYDLIVWNGSNPGDTSGKGYARINEALRYNPDLVIVEFGANDVLQDKDSRRTFRYLDAIIDICKGGRARDPRGHSVAAIKRFGLRGRLRQHLSGPRAQGSRLALPPFPRRSLRQLAVDATESTPTLTARPGSSQA